MNPKVILTTIPSDSHNWNLVYLQMLLEENGFDVINLGACVPYDLLVSSCIDVKPDLVVVSTINGHGFIEGKELIANIKDLPELENVDVIIGGKLSTDTNISSLYAIELENSGYSKVYCDVQNMNEFESYLKAYRVKRQCLLKHNQPTSYGAIIK